MSEVTKASLNFIEQIIEDDLETKHNVEVHTRFPPEPNGFLHIGHIKAICINFETAKKYGGKTNLRFDDTNPLTEKTLYVDNIKNDIRWLGYDWDDREYFASDYFPQLYQFAIDLIKKGLAYVDESTPEAIAEMKGTPTSPGKNSPYRDRSVEENLRLFEGMKNGDFEDGSMVLRAKIDMAHPNMLMRDPNLYRIKKATHHRTGDEWCIYPLYDFAHGQSDSIEKITYSLCSLEFRHHRDLYDWLIEKLEIFPSRQIEFARMNVAYMITSKRRLLKLVNENFVTGWDDPRMPTIAGMRRRGYPAAALRTFVGKVGVAKRENVIEYDLLESCVRDELNKSTPRVMAVLDPLKLVITNYPEGQVEQMEAINNPEDESMGTRTMPFSRELYIERKDFMEDPPKKFFRLGPDKTVRLKNGFIVSYENHIKDDEGNVTEVHVKYYPDSRSGSDTSGIKAKGVLHWVSIEQAIQVEVRNYDKLFTVEQPLADDEKDFMEFFNHDSLQVTNNVFVEPSLQAANVGDRFQFMRNGYYCFDIDSTTDHLVFNSTVNLKSGWKPKKK
ncbi:MAG: glutamine--tRNA ligase/YqeY domain fusion protein [Bacteroidota bacterium]